jgi:hypothetical protein
VARECVNLRHLWHGKRMGGIVKRSLAMVCPQVGDHPQASLEGATREMHAFAHSWKH